MSQLINIEAVIKDKKKDYFKVETTIGDFLISESMIVKYLILKGKSFTEEEFTDILNDISKEKYFSKVLNYISYQMRSEKEIKDYLFEKEASYEIVDYVIERLKTLNYVNDELLSEIILKECIKKQKGPKVLENKLFSKGISSDISQNILKNYTNDIQNEIIDSIALKFIDSNTKLPIKKQKQKLQSKLMYNGFDSYLVNAKINSYHYVDESDEDLKKQVRLLIEKYDNNLNYETKKKIMNKLVLKGYEYQKIKESFSSLDDE